ncbi:hypothetical protein ASU35_12555 [Acetivibrio ethanolgignens]|uniref:Transposase DDE domain-containing protein n=1 Tax=Acetivibrio ethanolgignens TaxID=290052 RepID=A0A0V8QDH0_9FIRM|nr:hypothetical protein ASU35_12555 [Acetivibrio ethanolgignens]
MNGCSYAIRLKQNSSLIALASDKDKDLYKATKEDQISYAVTYGEFMYQAGSWEYPKRVVFKIEKPYSQLTHMYTFIVTNMNMEPYQIIQFYCGRGKMENFSFTCLLTTYSIGSDDWSFLKTCESSRLIPFV